jgi:hypothetical protein
MKTSGGAASIIQRAGLIVATVALSCLVMLPLTSCKEFGSPEYTLTISLGSGITGTPVAGTYTYKNLTEINYEYTATDANLPAIVQVNTTKFSESGTFTMYCDLAVKVYVFDIRATWDFTLIPEDADDETDYITYQVTFSGSSLTSGTFTDTKGHSGTWTIVGEALTMTYSNWESYVLTETSVGLSLSGTYKNGDKDGSFTASVAD